jgi:predicted DNA-binding transcriptional regulator
MGEDEAPMALVEHLQTLGLERKEARLYAGLCIDGPQRASDLAARAKLNRTETYRALESLMDRGVVSAQLTKPTVYEAVPPEAAFADALRRHEGHRTSLEKAREAAIAQLDRLRDNRAPGGVKQAYRIVQGRRSILGVVESMLLNMTLGQRVVSTYFAPSNATAANRALHATLERAHAGLRMQMLFCRAEGLEQALGRVLADPRVHVRYFELDTPVRFTIVDEREVLFWLHTDPEPGLQAKGDVAMWTNASHFVRAQGILYDALWQRGKDLPRPNG